MNRKKYSIGNWKMNTNLAEAMILGEGIKAKMLEVKGVEVVLCPPFTWLYPLKEAFEPKIRNLHLGAQNVYFEEKGAFTGEVSLAMLVDLAEYVIIGHSERRQYFNEIDEVINNKVTSCIAAKITPILCVGERQKGEMTASENNVLAQVGKALSGLSEGEVQKIIISYEPVWAIGTGDAATPDYVAEVIGKIREKIAELYNTSVAQEISILYGGSVNEKNVSEYAKEEEIDGFLVGGASLKIDNFIEICKALNN